MKKIGMRMFFHGINFEYLEEQFPVLSPRRSVSTKNRIQMQDRKHLLKKFGFEPIHLLESDSKVYSIRRCLRECFAFGNVVLAFETLPLPFWQMSRHEIGVTVLNVKVCDWIAINRPSLRGQVKSLFPDKRILEYLSNN